CEQQELVHELIQSIIFRALLVVSKRDEGQALPAGGQEARIEIEIARLPADHGDEAKPCCDRQPATQGLLKKSEPSRSLKMPPRPRRAPACQHPEAATDDIGAVEIAGVDE